MTKKDYIVIAKAVFEARENVGNYIEDIDSVNQAFRCIIGELGRALADDNPRFDYDRFKRACNDGLVKTSAKSKQSHNI
jgi:hypothetical protein